MSADVIRLWTFDRGAIVRRNGTGPNMLVVRDLGATCACILCEGEAGGTLRLREFPTAELTLMLGAGR